MRAMSIQGISRSGRAVAALGAAVLLGGALAACGSDGGSDSASEATVTEGIVVEAEETSNGGAESTTELLEGAMSGGYSVVCDFTEPESSTAGTMYIKGEENFYLTADSPTGEIRMLQDSNMVYMWGPGTEMALSFDTSTDDDAAGDEMLSPAELQDEAIAENLSCKKYTGDMSVFQVPGDIEFLSFGDIFSGMTPEGMDPALLEQMMEDAMNGGN